MRKIVSLGISILFCISVSYSSEMVQISVEVTEINNNKALDLGVKWVNNMDFQEFPVGGATVSQQTVMNSNVIAPTVFNIDALGDIRRVTALKAQLKFLQENGAAQILSKPKLVTKSGTKARAFMGGQFPVIPPATSSSGGSGGIEWKEYGIIMEILPLIVNNGKEIDLSLKNTVSRLDWSNAVQGVPALVSREASSFVKVKSGQTITIAGLVETTDYQSTSGIPLLSKIPILGYLFSSKSTKKTKSTILIFVTPEIIQD